MSVVCTFGYRRKYSYFLNGVVTGSEWLKLGFMTRGLSLICGPSEGLLWTGLSGRFEEVGDDTVVDTEGLREGE